MAFGQDSGYLAEEFLSLATSSGVEVVAEFSLSRLVAHPKYLVGKGQAEAIADLVAQHQADVVLFNYSLSPSQERNLEEVCSCKVVDRNGLILDIFASRAQSYEGKLQVELAQLRHLSTRLVRGWTHLERQKGGIGLRGPGETQLETDRRLLSGRIKRIKRRLERVESQRSLSRKARSKAQVPTIALVGYTNAGKSTLFNALSGAQVSAQDRLFDTLDPSLRRASMPSIGEVVLVDTVGFVQDLPHELVAAFHSTLEETTLADLLLHVVDASDPHAFHHILEVENVIKEIGSDKIPILRIYNKIDILDNQGYWGEDSPDRQVIGVSAQTGLGFDGLKEAIAEQIAEGFVDDVWMLSPNQSQLRAKLYAMNSVLSESCSDYGEYELTLRLPRLAYSKLWKQWQRGK